jgi:hypothetical protein
MAFVSDPHGPSSSPDPTTSRIWLNPRVSSTTGQVPYRSGIYPRDFASVYPPEVCAALASPPAPSVALKPEDPQRDGFLPPIDAKQKEKKPKAHRGKATTISKMSGKVLDPPRQFSSISACLEHFGVIPPGGARRTNVTQALRRWASENHVVYNFE